MAVGVLVWSRDRLFGGLLTFCSYLCSHFGAPDFNPPSMEHDWGVLDQFPLRSWWVP